VNDRDTAIVVLLGGIAAAIMVPLAIVVGLILFWAWH